MENKNPNIYNSLVRQKIVVPETAGVYTFWKGQTPVYIGESINLKARLKSYFATNLFPKTARMVSQADRITFVKVSSELEALLLESNLVHKFKPKYNILLKDDKHALYIIITKEEFPRILSVRKLITKTQPVIASFGPFPNSTNVKTILKLIRKIFPYSDHKIGKKPCLYSHIGLCNPCPNLIVNNVEPVTKGKQIRQYKQNIRNIKLVLSRKFNTVRNNLDKEMNILSKQEKYEEASSLRDKIKALDYITQEKIPSEMFLENPNLTEDIRNQELESLKSVLTDHNLRPTDLKRIECFDIAHLSGLSTTASMVVAIGGEMENSEYRHFKVKQEKGNSDYDSMREIAKRRIKNLKSWTRPNLIIVDGGLGQVKIFSEEFKTLDIPVVGIAKNPDRLVFRDGTKAKLSSVTLNLVSRIRDEAHRFARRLHHKLISKSLLK